MSFIYPRTVSVSRPVNQTAVGVQPYAAVTKGTEKPLPGLQGMPASIQAERYRGRPEGETPSDNPERVQWKIFIPLAQSPLGSIEERDIVTDDLAKRYVVIGAYWNSLGYRISAELLQA